MASPVDLRYSREHEWVRIDGGLAVVGITDYAQDQLGDVVYVELPEVGRQLQHGTTFGVVESVKSVSDLYVPVDGEVAEVNQDLVDRPETVNQDPYGAAWMIKLKNVDQTQLARLMSATEYEEYLKTL